MNSDMSRVTGVVVGQFVVAAGKQIDDRQFKNVGKTSFESSCRKVRATYKLSPSSLSPLSQNKSRSCKTFQTDEHEFYPYANFKMAIKLIFI